MPNPKKKIELYVLLIKNNIKILETDNSQDYELRHSYYVIEKATNNLLNKLRSSQGLNEHKEIQDAVKFVHVLFFEYLNKNDFDFIMIYLYEKVQYYLNNY